MTKRDRAASQLVFTLSQEGFDAIVVDSPAEALLELARRRVDLFVLDLDLRALDLAREVRTAYPRTRVVLTGRVPLSQRQLERLDCGAVSFFAKPFDLRGAASFMSVCLGGIPAFRRLWHAEQPSSYAL